MNLQEQLSAFRQKRNDITERQTQIMSAAGDEGRTLDDEESSEYDGLTKEVSHVDAHIKRLEVLIKGEGDTAKSVAGGSQAPMGFVRKQDPDDQFQGQSFVRRVVAKALAQMSDGEMTAGQIAERRWGKSHPNLVRYIKEPVPVAGGDSTTDAWAGRLVTPDNRYMGDFLEYLKARTVYDQLPLREIPAHVTVKGQDGIGTGYWVGESAAIPVSAQQFTTVSLTPLKVAAMSVISNELIRDSSPSAEMLVRDGLIEAIAQRIDTTFLSTSAASSGVSPAGILEGLTPEDASGTDAAALRHDIMELYKAFITARNADGLEMVMHPSLAKTISLMVNALGQTEFPGLNSMGGTLLGDRVVTGHNVNTAHLILLKPSDIWRIGDMGIEVSLSRDATIEQVSNPTGDSGTPAGAANVSMFQTESTAFKVVRPMNFQLRRPSVEYVGDAAYSLTEAEGG